VLSSRRLLIAEAKAADAARSTSPGDPRPIVSAVAPTGYGKTTLLWQ
jgi:hypothetical protein